MADDTGGETTATVSQKKTPGEAQEMTTTTTKKKTSGANWNVKCALATSLFIGLADSVWNGTVLATYIYDLKHSNTFVGIVEAANGLTQLCIAFPVGAWADSKDPKTGKKRTIAVTRLGCPATLFAACSTAALIWAITFGGFSGSPETLLVWSLILANVIWGAVEAVVMGPFQAMFGDSLPTGDRSYYYSLLYAGYIGASAAGPTLSIGLFVWWGNDWSPRRLARVLLAGMALECVNAPCYLLFKDSSLLGEEADAVGERPCAIANDDDDDRYRRLEEEEEESKAAETEPDDDDDDDKVVKNKTVVIFGKSFETSSYVPWTLFTASILSAIGSGATVKFFPLFFKNQVGLSPIETQLVYVVVPIAMVVAMSLAQSTHPKIGRVQTMVSAKLCAVGLLVAMIFVTKSEKYKRSGWVMVPIYVVRTALANCTYPIEESILMDYVPRDRRARWKSLESVASFGWCGSALIGGVIADAFSYSTTFGLTAALQSVSAIVALGLIFVVPKKETDLLLNSDGDDDTTSGAAAAVSDVAFDAARSDVAQSDDRSMDFGGDDTGVGVAPSEGRPSSVGVPDSTPSEAGEPRISLPSWGAIFSSNKQQQPADGDSTTSPLINNGSTT